MSAVLILVSVVLAALNLALWELKSRLREEGVTIRAAPTLMWIPGRLKLERVEVSLAASTCRLWAQRLRSKLDLFALAGGRVRLTELAVVGGRLTCASQAVAFFHTSPGLEAEAVLELSASVHELRLERASVDLERVGVADEGVAMEGGMRLEVLQLRRSRGAWACRRCRLLLHRTQLTSSVSFVRTVHGTVDLDSPRELTFALTFAEAPTANPILALDAELFLHDGRFALPSNARVRLLETFEATGLGRNWRVAEASELVATLSKDTHQTQIVLQSPLVEAGARGRASQDVSARNVTVSWQGENRTGTEAILPRAAKMELQAPSLEIQTGTPFGRVESPLKIVAAFTRQVGGGWVAGPVRFELEQLRSAGRQQRQDTPPSFSLRLPSVNLSKRDASLRGHVTVRGEELSGLLALLPLPPFVGLLAAPFSTERFSGGAELSRDGEVLALRDVTLVTSNLRARGFVTSLAEGTAPSGAFVFTTPAMAMGLRFGPDGVHRTWRPARDWIDKLQR